MSGGRKELDVFILAGEASGDLLGAGLMEALAAEAGGAVRFRGVGGSRMVEAGLVPLFPAHDLMTIGIGPVLAKLPRLLRRLRETVDAIVATPPDLLVLIDVPDFSLRIARRVRQRLPELPVVKYVSPTVWAWRPGRARAMRPIVDLILAVFPFEPEVHRRLGGPPCVYVGHPLLAQRDELRPSPQEAELRRTRPLVLALPGSRPLEIRRLGGIFGEALGRLADARESFEVVVPTLPERADQVAAVTARWPLPVRVVTDEAGKLAAFRRARAALAASGTVTLELALSGVPHVAAYRIPLIEEAIARLLLHVKTVVLANLVLDEMVVPQFLQADCTAGRIAAGLSEVLGDTPLRRRQEAAFARLDDVLGTSATPPSVRAARAVLELLKQRV
jgi:lipid-A-disaccharide synthase